MGPRRTAGVPGDLLLHPVALGCLVLLVVNDHWLKGRYGNAVTGKLSDVAGIAVFPLLLVSLLEIGRWVGGRARWAHRPGEVLVAMAVTAAGFGAVKTSPVAGGIYVEAFGALRWSVATVVGLATGSGVPPRRGVDLVRDRGDLLVLPVLALTWVVAARVRRRRTAASGPAARSSCRDECHLP